MDQQAKQEGNETLQKAADYLMANGFHVCRKGF